jgi:nucleotide-binding universal stress UspA family protein
VDGSACSERALGVAVALTRRFAAVLHVLHVYQVPAYVQPGLLVWAAVGPRPLWQLAEEQGQAELERLLASFSPADRALMLPLLEAGDPATAILEAAKSHAADLVVMGTHGRTGLRRLALGSVAERVVRAASAAVLVVPESSDPDRSHHSTSPELGREGAPK